MSVPVYDPPTQASDPRICRRCLSYTGTWSNVRWWPLLNTHTGRYHCERPFEGATACGKDARADHWLWPS